MELTYEKEIRIMGNPIGQINKTKHVCVKLVWTDLLPKVACQYKKNE